ncbi:MAG: 23S rRNA (guanosine(2251)-2'-O)-methyltransferase RlmB [Spirochaetes bacterium]|nr:23S rRNA (guanosine(2251)-2'-O)-methyltransferase RlmB [Spirochaetota bacterium]MBU1081385.1 23S rRNA (guanosine(2251)-2'-O)-methyltransferase RlmB [Spirochaetota bacterium]
MTYITGFHAMEELVRSGKAKGATLLVAAAGPRIKKIIELAERSGLRPKAVSARELDAAAPDNRGAAIALAEAPRAAELDLDSWLERGVPETALVVVLDHIEDPHNLGAILRSSDVFAADLVVVPERRAAKETDTVARSSAGAAAYVPTASVPNLARAVERLKEAGFWTYAADMGGQSLPDAELSGRVAVVLGAEGSGVSRLLKERCDGSLSIPQYGHVDSLNVSVAAGVILYEVRKRLGPPRAR